MERWLPVVGYEGQYEVSDHGRVRSLDRVVMQRKKRGAVVSQRYQGALKRQLAIFQEGRLARMTVNLSQGGQKKVWSVHCLVLKAFVGPRPDGMEGCHWDGNPANNRLSNLRWDTPAGNLADAMRHGTKRGPKNPARGERHHEATLSFEQVEAIREAIAAGVHKKVLAAQYGVSLRSIYNYWHGYVRQAA